MPYHYPSKSLPQMDHWGHQRKTETADHFTQLFSDKISSNLISDSKELLNKIQTSHSMCVMYSEANKKHTSKDMEVYL